MSSMMNTVCLNEDNEMILYEKVDLNKVEYLLAKDEITGDFEKDSEISRILRVIRSKVEKGRFKAYYAFAPKWNGRGRMSAYTATGGKRKGNYYASQGVIKSYVRGFLAEDNYVDVDMVSCHWNILRHLFSVNHLNAGLVDTFLDEYKTMKSTIDKEEFKLVKQGFFNSLYTSPSYMSKSVRKNMSRSEVLSQIHEVVYNILVPVLQNQEEELYKSSVKNDILKTGGKNAPGSFISNYIQNIECEIVRKVIHLLNNKNIKVDCMIHDGFWVGKEYEDQLSDILPEISTILSEQYKGMNIVFVVKPFPPHPFDDYDPDEISFENFETNYLFDMDDPYDFTTFRYEVNRQVFTDMNSMKQFVFTNLPRVVYPVDMPQLYIYKSDMKKVELVKTLPDCFLAYYSRNEKGDSEERYVSLASFIKTPTIQRCLKPLKKVTFNPDPNTQEEHVFNMYAGMSASIVPEVNIEKIRPILDHIRYCWADGNEEYYRYQLQWLKNAFTCPWKKTGIVLFLYGCQGSGKSLIIDNFFVPFIYGEDTSCKIQGLSAVTQQFNSILMNKLFIFVDELTSQNFHGSFDKLKSLITDYRMNIEKKGIDIFNSYPNYIDFMMSSNNFDSIKLETSDRRYACFKTSDRYVRDFKYFAELSSTFNQDTADHFFTYLARMKDTVEIRDIPKTELREEMLTYNTTNSVDKFVLDLEEYKEEIMAIKDTPDLRERYTWDFRVFKHCVDGEIPARTLFSIYKDWCKENNEAIKTNNRFGRVISKHYAKKRNNRGNVYKIW